MAAIAEHDVLAGRGQGRRADANEEEPCGRAGISSTVAAGLARRLRHARVASPQDDIRCCSNSANWLRSAGALRQDLPKDLAERSPKYGTGFREVRAPVANTPAVALRSIRWWRCQSAHMQFERLRDDPASAFAEAKALGASWVSGASYCALRRSSRATTR